MARPERFELPTNRFEAGYSIQLSYGRIISSIVLTVIVSETNSAFALLLLPSSLCSSGPAARLHPRGVRSCRSCAPTSLREPLLTFGQVARLRRLLKKRVPIHANCPATYGRIIWSIVLLTLSNHIFNCSDNFFVRQLNRTAFCWHKAS